MANPLARVVMNGIAQKSGKVEERSSNTNNRPNLGKQGTQLLTSLLNNNNKNKSGSSSYNKSTYGRSSNVSNSSTSMQSLDSLVSGKVDTSKNTLDQNVKSNVEGNRSRQNLKSLCTLDNISVGKTNTSASINVSTNSNRNNVKALSLNELVKGEKSVKQETKTSYEKQTGSMTTLQDLVPVKSKISDETKGVKSENVATNNSGYVRSNVMSNLDAYVPKVTLESIGKKGSLF